MAEEHRCQAQRLCANNCGFFGSPATQDFCSKCYRDLQLKEQGKLALNQTLATSSGSAAAAMAAASSSSVSVSVSSPAADLAAEGGRKIQTTAEAVPVPLPVPEAGLERKDVVAAAVPNRCSQCRRRVGLTGFKCKCEMTFCGVHRYPEQHSCGFDFKSLGKEQIAKANPVVKGEKLRKI